MNYLNFPLNQSISSIQEHIDQLQPIWIHPTGYFDRIMVGEFSTGRQVMEYLQTCTKIENEPSTEESRCNQCDFKHEKNPIPIGFQPSDLIPSIICSVDTAYELERILHVFEENRQLIKVEIMTGDTAEDLKTLQYFLEDKLSELKLGFPPTCSLIHRIYEIDYSNLQKKRKASVTHRRHLLPIEFRNILKRSQPVHYKKMMGGEYYSSRVFTSIIRLLFDQWQRSIGTRLESSLMEKTEQILAALADQWSSYSFLKQIPIPPYPMKAFDLLERQGAMEFHWVKKNFPLSFLSGWLQQITALSGQIDQGIGSFRLCCNYDAWHIEEQIYEARNDQVILSWNDGDLAFRQQNIPNLFYFLHHFPYLSFYWRFTSNVEENDPRIKSIEQNLHRTFHLR